jgi:hypothetical protein
MQTGKYILHKNSFLAGNSKFVIKERKKPSTKPALYLIQLEPFSYISSLFPVPTTSTEEFTFDYGKRLYSLRKLENEVEVVELEP